jgi:hypothetical protein
MSGGRVSRGSSRLRLKSASIIIRVAVSNRLVLPGTLPKMALTRERSQAGINLPSIFLSAYLNGMSKLYRVALGASAAALIASIAYADGPDISAERMRTQYGVEWAVAA